jgi:D-serine dehydratase
VLSRPQPDRLILNCGRRDVSFDAGLPVVLAEDGRERGNLRLVALNDQHAHVEVSDPEVAIAPGDVLRLGISHPCTTLDRWRVAPLVGDSDQVIGAITTCF